VLRDHYATLEAAPDADHEVIKAGFRALAKKYHRDTAADPMAAKARFREINEAHSVLSNPEARAKYDRPSRRTRSLANRGIAQGPRRVRKRPRDEDQATWARSNTGRQLSLCSALYLLFCSSSA
jgi:curved DNA-binding protein CbpA